jgi:hypothetical protein
MNIQEEKTRLLEEIQQIKAQYEAEVKRSRSPWPEALKKRAARLHGLGLRGKEIAERTGLPYYTLLTWLPRCRDRGKVVRAHEALASGEFTAIAINENPKTATVTVADNICNPKPAVSRASLTVSVVLPNGARIEGVTPEFLSAWMEQGGAT